MTLQNQNLEQFSFIVSHNLRAPVARLKGLASLIPYDLDKEELKKITQMIKSASLDLDVVLSDLTHIIDIKSRPIENREYIDMTDLFNSIIDLMREDIETINAKVEIEIQDANQILSIKPYIRSVFTNLLSNAIKYRSHNRALVIQIQGHAVDGFHVFKVIDNGLGIDLHDGNKSKIFGLYQRFHNDIEGRGLGLYLVKTQLESLGGDISVESNPQGGTSFTICLPIN
ncbi:MAG: HAMP domain-containing histidine kinase [Cyclobacteriaceae bacterium]|nr:HAMP domain-containing histidine kinase [Cyclobacteriaceae bacterium]